MKEPSGNKTFDPGPLIMLGVTVLCALALLLFGNGDPGRHPAPAPVTSTPFPAPAGLRIAVASDLHLDPDNVDKSGEPPETVYNLELADALLWDARAQGAEILLLTGDLVNGGKLHKHRALIEKLSRAEDAGLAVYVLPGNHDLAPVSQAEFAALYGPFGYDEACSRDPASLSYCVRREDLMLLMMDTGGYAPGAVDLPGSGMPESGEAFLSEATLGWAEEQLTQARQQGLHVLCAGHYNLLSELSRQPGSGVYLENADRFAGLLREYGVPLYLSGHMHISAVTQTAGLTELLTPYLLAYPTGYTVLDLTETTLHFTPRRIDVNAWARETGRQDPVLLDFAAWQQEGLRSYSAENVRYMAERNPLSAREQEQAAAFFYAVMDAFWDGSLYDRRGELEAMAGYGPFFRCAESYSYSWWLKDLIQSASPLLRGFTLKW